MNTNTNHDGLTQVENYHILSPWAQNAIVNGYVDTGWFIVDGNNAWVYHSNFLSDGWIWHYGLGWIFTSDNDPDSLSLYLSGVPDLGWVWTSRDYYPWMYSYDKSGWYMYNQSSTSPLGFWDDQLDAWVNFIRNETQPF